MRLATATALLALASCAPSSAPAREFPLPRTDGQVIINTGYCSVSRYEDRVDANTIVIVYVGCDGIAAVRR